MKKKILSLLYILALALTSYDALASDSPPTLPMPETAVNTSDDTKSFWTKTMNFFGFKDEEQKKNDQKSNTPEEQTAKPVINSENKNNENSLEPLQKESININKETSSTPADPVSNIAAADNSKKNEVINNQTPQNIRNSADLQLPDIVPDKVELDEGPSNDKKTTIDNTISNNQEPSKQDVEKVDPTLNTIDLKLPDDIGLDEGPSNDKKTTIDNTISNNQEPSKQDVEKVDPTLNTIDLKLPDDIGLDEGPSNDKKTTIDNTISNNQEPSKQDVKEQTELDQDVALTLPSNNTDNKESAQPSTPSPFINPNSTQNIEIKKEEPQLIDKGTSGQKTEKPSDGLQPTQNSVPEVSKNTGDFPLQSYRQHLQERLNKPEKLPEILKEDLNQVSIKAMDPEQMKFVNDEAQVLLLPNDEVVMGEVTKESQLDLMDLSAYIKVFWNNYDNIKAEPARQSINNFIDNYDSNFHKQPSYSQKEIGNILIEAFKAIDKNSIYDLMNLLDNYPILQLVDQQGNSLLHKSVYKNNYSAAKFLIMKGIDISIRNNQGLTARDVAIAQKKPNIETLLRSAGGE